MTMLSEVSTALVQDKYQVESVVKVDTPKGMTGDEWYHYTIIFGKKTIEGMKPGSLFSVTQHAEEFVENLNERSGKYGSQAYRSKKK